MEAFSSFIGDRGSIEIDPNRCLADNQAAEFAGIFMTGLAEVADAFRDSNIDKVVSLVTGDQSALDEEHPTALSTLQARLRANDTGSLQLQQDSLSFDRVPISGKASDRAAQAMGLYIGQGIAKSAAAGIVGTCWSRATSTRTPLAAFGIAQHRGSRAREMVANGTDLESQLQFILKEMRRENPGLLERMSAASPAEASRMFSNDFERPNKKYANNAKRAAYAKSLHADDYEDRARQTSSDTAELAKIDSDSKKTAQKTSLNLQIKNAEAQIGNLRTQVKVSDTTRSIEKLTAATREWHEKIIEAEIAKFKTDNPDPNVAGYDENLQALKDRLGAETVKDITALQEQYFQAAEEELHKPVELAQLKLSTAQRPENANKYTQNDIIDLENNVRLAETEERLGRIKLLQEQIAAAKQLAASTEAGSTENEAALTREAELKARLVDLTNRKNVADAATAAQGPSVAGAIQGATTAWAQQEGILDSAGKMIPLATQVGNVWGEVMSGLSSSLSTFFTDIASGTMTAGEAFKKLGLSVVNMFMQIIAKALANQIIMSLFGGGAGAAGGAGGGILSSLFGVIGGGAGAFPAAPGGGLYANGGAIRAANGRGIPGRDSVLVRAMPGEYIMRQSAVKAAGGVGALDQMNNQANRRLSINDSNLAAANQNKQARQETNVWVVSPDQAPPMGPNDVIATISDNIQRRGPVRELIKQAVAGNI